MIKVVFFAALREQLNCAGLELSADENTDSIAKIKQLLVEQNPNWQQTFSNASLLSAVNHEMVDGSHPVKSGDEVAFFPPVTGG
ncbi:molybdopterin converting factor subunit 1 [Thalassomonas haliotis]|uniref:Molybdopterin synthase sulfur carrier subunit n=1 Tax=Thalassomonas haliotis TaxID=485448 RepID=A0ABY7VGR8_9GAMM|nr:molybdopterin converting factor subunit 1 [Thalassomonas haliotis]WDE12663.1 molybdopterin converting factor subunit 1 [Thalassomonas haliotis]